MQSKPCAWLSWRSVFAARTGPIWPAARFSGDGHGLDPGGRAAAVVTVDVERVDVLVRGAPPRFEHAGAPAAVLGHARHAATGDRAVRVANL